MRLLAKTILTMFILLACAWANAQVNDTLPLQHPDTVAAVNVVDRGIMHIDSIVDNTIAAGMQKLDADSSRISQKRSNINSGIETPRFIPDPGKATWLAVAFPGAGQIYNRKYWKLPIVYGGFIGCLYAFNWNSQMYSDYRQAFLDIMDTDPNTNSYEDFFRPGYDFEKNREYLTELFKKRKDRYRRWRDLSVFAFIGVYALSIIDAYVDAQLASFDISDDINLSLTPQMIHSGRIGTAENYYGLNCNITF